MFSEELAILDRNTAKYMVDEMQNAIDKMQSKIVGMQNRMQEQESIINEMQQQSVRKTLAILRNLKIPEAQIIQQLAAQYELSEEQVHLLL